MSSAYPLSSPIEVEGTGGAPGQIDFSDGTNVVEVKAPTTLTGTVNFTLPDTDGTAGQVLNWPSSGTTTVWANNVGNPNSTIPISLRFNSPSGNPATTTSTTYVVLATFFYNGTILDSPMTTAAAIVSTSNTSAQGQVQLFDLTNSLIIATSAVYGPSAVAGGKIPLLMGSISNLPTGPSMFEVQLQKVGGGGGSAEIHAFQAIG